MSTLAEVIDIAADASMLNESSMSQAVLGNRRAMAQSIDASDLLRRRRECQRSTMKRISVCKELTSAMRWLTKSAACACWRSSHLRASRY